MSRTLLITFLSLFTVTLCDADSTDFRLIYSQGQVHFRLAKGEVWNPLTNSDTLSPQCTLRVQRGGYLLIESPKGYLEFNIGGNYVISEYVNEIALRSQIASEYASKARDSLMKSLRKDEKRYATPLIDLRTDNKDLLSLYPPPTIIYDESITLKWRPMDDNIYIVKMYHTEQSQYFYREINGDQVTVNMRSLNFPTDRCIYWTVTVKGSEYSSVPKCVYILNIGESSNIELPAYEMREEFNLERSALHNLTMAIYFEEHKVQYKAEEYYEKAWSLSGNSERYKQIYYDFMERRNQLVID